MDVTLALARCVADSNLAEVPESVQDEAVRILVDGLACALGGSLEPALDTALDALHAVHGPQQATLIGRGDRIDVLNAAFLSGLGAGSLDYAATHAATLAQPGVAVAGALLPLAEFRAASGAAVVHAFILGLESACRIGLALGEGHGERGWDPSSTCGVIGAAVACAKLLGLDAERAAWAIGIAATQASGLAETNAGPSLGLNLGCASRDGVQAALLAEQGFTASARALEGHRGLLHVLGAEARPAAVIADWGRHWECTRVACKPYPCSLLLHPAIAACLQLRLRHDIRPSAIAGVDLRVHPSVLAVAGGRDPLDGAQARTSVHHAAAVALFDGAAGLRQFRSERVRHARVAELRQRVEAIADADLGKDEARVTLALHDGRSVERHVRRGSGSLDRPLSDDELSARFRGLASELLATDQAERVLALAWNVRALADVGALVRASVPEDTLEPAELPGSPLIPR